MQDTPEFAIAIDVATRYLNEQSRPGEDLYYFAYTIGIRNTGARAAQLISRRWRVVDATGGLREVEGEGVVGEQPRLRPGERFEYTSTTSFSTPCGTMEGAYVLRADDGTEFEAPIPPFVLCIPRTLH
ncbi:MAG: Co2+/Mg2+ efflux protein ApaG [Xanthomonadales bacterium]|nr:Co2+/Mg2+ efflux protein ApaG [Xanthomonadales bacterium]